MKLAKKIDESAPVLLKCRELFEFATPFMVLNVNRSLHIPIQTVGLFETLQAVSAIVMAMSTMKNSNSQCSGAWNCLLNKLCQNSLCVARSLGLLNSSWVSTIQTAVLFETRHHEVRVMDMDLAEFGR